MHLPRRPPLAPEEYRRFLEYRSEQTRPFERLSAIAGALSVLVFALWDNEVDGSALDDTVPIRLGLAVLLMLLYAGTFTRLGRHHGALQLLSAGVIVGGFSWVLTELPDGFTIGLAGLALSIALLPLIAITMRWLLLLCAVGVLLPNLFLLGTDAGGFTYVNVNVWMGLAVSLAVSFWYVFDIVNRRLFIAEEGLVVARQRADHLIANILPAEIGERLKEAEATGADAVVADRYDVVSVLFADIVGFTAFARDREPDVVVAMLNELFTQFDDLVSRHGLEKIKTLGDGYMVAGGVPAVRSEHPAAVADLALAMLATTHAFSTERRLEWEMRIGIHAGPVVAGVIGKRRLAYDLWGDAVNVASRLESTGVAGRIQVSATFARLLPDSYRLERRGVIELKNRGTATTYFLTGRDRAGSADPAAVGSDASAAEAARHPQAPTTTAKSAPAT